MRRDPIHFRAANCGARITTPRAHATWRCIRRAIGFGIYYSNIGDAPERIFRCHLELTGDWNTWSTSVPEEILRPETGWEGAGLPLQKSAAGAVKGRENALRDPAIFVEQSRAYLLYSVAGESGIALAELKAGPQP